LLNGGLFFHMEHQAFRIIGDWDGKHFPVGVADINQGFSVD